MGFGIRMAEKLAEEGDVDEDTKPIASEKIKPSIVCLCGSTRFYDEFQEANYRFTMGGMIVLSVGFYPHSQQQIHGQTVGCTEEQKAQLDELHKRKIDLADLVFVLNVGGYVGDSTASEIEYAEEMDKAVIYFDNGHEDGIPSIQRIEAWTRCGDKISAEDKIIRHATDAVIKQMHDATERDFVDRAFLAWLYRHLETVHRENKDLDYMIRLRGIVDAPKDTIRLQQQTISGLMDERDKLVESINKHAQLLQNKFDKYKHLDSVLSDAGDDEDPFHKVANELWLTIRFYLRLHHKKSGFDPATLGGDYSVTLFQAKRGNVVLEKATGKKCCVYEDEKLKADEWELVCETPHADDDFSYLCNNEHCRCYQ